MIGDRPLTKPVLAEHDAGSLGSRIPTELGVNSSQIQKYTKLVIYRLPIPEYLWYCPSEGLSVLHINRTPDSHIAAYDALGDFLTKMRTTNDTPPDHYQSGCQAATI